MKLKEGFIQGFLKRSWSLIIIFTAFMKIQMQSGQAEKQLKKSVPNYLCCGMSPSLIYSLYIREQTENIKK